MGAATQSQLAVWAGFFCWCQHGLRSMALGHDDPAVTILLLLYLHAWAHCEPLQSLQAEGCDIVISWSGRWLLRLCSRGFLPWETRQ